MHYEPLTNEERLLIENLLRQRMEQTSANVDSQSYRVAHQALSTLRNAVDVIVVTSADGPGRMVL